MRNFTFLKVVFIILVISSIIFTGCSVIQTSTQMNFDEMYDISDDGKTITVISKEYLDEFWNSNYRKEEIHSFSKEEVDFIIQDSIRIYNTYDKVILLEFAPDSGTEQIVANRFPSVKGQEICRSTDSDVDADNTNIDIYAIILYRLRALSSPKAFFNGEEAILSVNGSPEIYSSMLPWTTFYISDYSENTDKEYILSVVGNSVMSNDDYLDFERFADLYGFCNKNVPQIFFQSKTTRQEFQVFPTKKNDD